MTSRDLLTPILTSRSGIEGFTPREWEALIGQAFQAHLLPRLAYHLFDHYTAEYIPAKPRLYLEGAIRLALRQHQEAHWEVDCIRRSLSAIDTPIVLLKGAAYLLSDLSASRGRLFSDIDIMVNKTCLPEIESVLLEHGWVSEERDEYNDRYYREWMHEIPPKRHVLRNTVIDVHHTITPPTSRFKVSGSKLMERITPISSEDNLFVLSPEDMVLHSASHFFMEGEFGHGLRDILDIKDLLQTWGDKQNFWDNLFSRAIELGLSEPLYHVLSLIDNLFGKTIPCDQARGLPTSLSSRILLPKLLNLAITPIHPSCNNIPERLSRWILYLRSHLLRMPMHLLLPHLARKAYVQHFGVKVQ